MAKAKKKTSNLLYVAIGMDQYGDYPLTACGRSKKEAAENFRDYDGGIIEKFVAVDFKSGHSSNLDLIPLEKVCS